MTLLIPQDCDGHKRAVWVQMIKTKPPIPTKPQIKEETPQKALDSPRSSTNMSTAAECRPTPKPRLHKPAPLNHTLNQTDQVSLSNADSAASSKSHFCLSV